MKYKEGSLIAQHLNRPELLLKMANDFEKLSRAFGIEPVVTRVLERISGSSGVHEAGRAIDFRDQYLGTRLYTKEQISIILTEINGKYRRKDGRVTLIHHGFNGGPEHFHLQLAPNLEIYYDQPKEEKPLPDGYEPKAPSILEREKPQDRSQSDERLRDPSSEDSLLRPAVVILLCLATCLLIALLV